MLNILSLDFLKFDKIPCTPCTIVQGISSKIARREFPIFIIFLIYIHVHVLVLHRNFEMILIKIYEFLKLLKSQAKDHGL